MCIHMELNDCIYIFLMVYFRYLCDVMYWHETVIIWTHLMLLPFLHRYCQNKINTNLSDSPNIVSFELLFPNCKIIREPLSYTSSLPYTADSSRLGSQCEISIYYTLLNLSKTIHIPKCLIFCLVEYTEMLFSVNDSVLVSTCITRHYW